MKQQLPHSPDLSHLKKQAKDLLRAFQKSDPSAIERFGADYRRLDTQLEDLTSRECKLGTFISED